MTENPFAPREKLPSVSWKDVPVGHSITGRVIETPAETQHRDFATGKPDTWENGDAKMSVVTRLDIGGEKQALWCVKPSALYGAILEAVQRIGAPGVEVGGWLKVTYTGDAPSKSGGFPAKQFHVDYSAPNAFAGGEQQQQQQPAGNGWGGNGAGYQERRPDPAQQQAPAYAQQPAQPAYTPPQQPAADPWATPPRSDEPPF